MAWCDTCNRIVDDSEQTDEGTCPTCDSALEERRPVPWHFKLLLGATVIYLGWRSFQGIDWLVHHA
ncbi:MAG: hypothetical protein ACRDY1_09290 [Acidimicrobiales bacterium]